jgi:hypothetical protein
MELHADSIVRRSPLLSHCSEPLCTTLTMGGTCVEHDPVELPERQHGAPFAEGHEPFVSTTQREVRSRMPVE